MESIMLTDNTWHESPLRRHYITSLATARNEKEFPKPSITVPLQGDGLPPPWSFYISGEASST
jgi:hypothetical protein